MIASLTDNSTETFWESGDEDRNRSKFLTIKCHVKASARILYVHIDNARDLGVSQFTLSYGNSDLFSSSKRTKSKRVSMKS